MADDSRTDMISPYDRMGGDEGVRRLAERFYAIMDADPAAAGVRGMHEADLGPIADRLGEFLRGWTGGPRDWFLRPDRPCIMGLHRALDIGVDERDQWMACMTQAVDGTVADPQVRDVLIAAFFRMAEAMRTR